MPVLKLFLGTLLALLVGGCTLPRPWRAPLPTDRCPKGQPGQEELLVVSFRAPDCRKNGLRWTAYRPDGPQHSVADVARRTRLVEDKDWEKELARRVAETKAAPVIYIHGFYNGQEDALGRALALRVLLCPRRPEPVDVYNCRPRRPVVALTWPSHNRFAKYAWDEANNEWSLEASVATILAIARNHKGTTLVAHSMGNRILVAAAIAAQREPELFDRLVLASPDVDRGQVARLLARDLGLGFHATIYGSRKDQALSASWRTHGYPRAGDLSHWVSGRSPGYPYQKFNNADIVDTTDARAGKIAHAAFVDSIEGAADLCHVLAGDPIKPGRERYKLSAYWMLRKGLRSSDDCAALARAAVLIANGKPPPNY